MFNSSCQAVAQDVGGNAAHPSAMSSFAFSHKPGQVGHYEEPPTLNFDHPIAFLYETNVAVVPRADSKPGPVSYYEDISDAEVEDDEEDEDAILDALVREPPVSGIGIEPEEMEEYWNYSSSEPVFEEPAEQKSAALPAAEEHASPGEMYGDPEFADLANWVCEIDVPPADS